MCVEISARFSSLKGISVGKNGELISVQDKLKIMLKLA